MVTETIGTSARAPFYRRAIGIFDSSEKTERAIHALKDANFDLKNNVSLIARNVENVDNVTEVRKDEGNEADTGAGAGATAGTVLGGIGGLLVGLGALVVPGLGPIIVAGEAIATTLAGAGIGAAGGGLVGALVGMAIPEEKAEIYQERVKAGYYLLIVDGTTDEILRAESILRQEGIEELEIVDATDRNARTVL
ncbi:MAG: hypothetical protein ACFBSE_06475 [Prochloraceae cyanobacterium]